MNTRSRNSLMGLAVALAAAALAPAAGAGRGPDLHTTSNVGVAHNAATPIDVDCTGGSAGTRRADHQRSRRTGR